MSAANSGPSAFDITKTAELMRDLRASAVERQMPSQPSAASAGSDASADPVVWVSSSVSTWTVRARR